MKVFRYLFTLKSVSSVFLFEFEDKRQEADVVSYIEWLVHIHLVAVLLQGLLWDCFQQNPVFFLAKSLYDQHKVQSWVGYFLKALTKRIRFKKCLLRIIYMVKRIIPISKARKNVNDIDYFCKVVYKIFKPFFEFYILILDFKNKYYTLNLINVCFFHILRCLTILIHIELIEKT